MSSTVYRFAGADDFTTICELNRELLADDGLADALSKEHLRDRFLKWLANGHEVLIFERGGAAIGYALYCVGKRETGERIVYLQHFIIGRNNRRKGLGREAMSQLLNCVWPKDAMVCVETRESNVAAIALWQSLGFTIYSHNFILTPQLRVEEFRQSVKGDSLPRNNFS